MKRTITEIFIEVEETIAVRQTGKLVAENELCPANESAVCPHCGQAIPENKNLQQQEEENKDES